MTQRKWISKWVSSNPILADGELGFEVNTGRIKIGDGVSKWTQLPYSGPTMIPAQFDDLIEAFQVQYGSGGGGTTTGGGTTVDNATYLVAEDSSVLTDESGNPLTDEASDNTTTTTTTTQTPTGTVVIASLPAAAALDFTELLRISQGGTDKKLALSQLFAKESGREIAAAVINTNFTPTDATSQDVPGASIIVPANSGPCTVQVAGNITLSYTTGTNPSTTSQRVSVYIMDELNNIVALGQTTLFGTGVSQGLGFSIPIGAAVPNSPTDKTYRLQVGFQRQGANGATGAIAAAPPYPALTLQAVRR